MFTKQSASQEVEIESNIGTNVRPSDIKQLIEIASVYDPNDDLMRKTVNHHLQHADSLRLARGNKNVIAGYSIASSSRRLTPFYPHPVSLLYQRMLYISPDFLHRGLGKRLLCAAFRDLLGPLWPFLRFALVCSTQNPAVARLMDIHTISYPHSDEPIPDEVRAFGESLLPMFGAVELDMQFRLLGTFYEYELKNVDYTEIWYRYLHKQNNSYDRLIFDRAFTMKNGKIINNGAHLLMVAYSKPLQFIHWLLR